MDEPVRITGEKFYVAGQGRFLYHDVLTSVGKVPGVYHLHVGDGLSGFLALPRLLDPDPFGILYIGTAARLHERLGELQKALSVAYGRGQWTGSRHGLLSKIQLVPRFLESFPFDRLFVTVQPLARPEENNRDVVQEEDHYGQEKRVLVEYKRRYGELPPLNAF